MTRAAGIFVSLFITLVSLTLLGSAGWLWYRSMHHVDVLARVEPAPGNQSTMTDVGSYKGAVLIGSVDDPMPARGDTSYAHNVFPISGSGKGILHVVPTVKRGALGFGASKGELRVTLPMFSFLSPPPRRFEVVYVPYYFFMLVGLVYPARMMFRRRRVAVGVQPHSLS